MSKKNNNLPYQKDFELPEYELDTGGPSNQNIASNELPQQQQLLHNSDKPTISKLLFRGSKIPIVCFSIFGVSLLIFLLIWFALLPVTPGYHVSSFHQDEYQYSALLEPNYPQIQIWPRDNQTKLDLLPHLNITIKCYSANHYQVKIKDADNQRWEIPEQHPYPFVENPKPCNFKETDIEFSIQQNPFSIKITRKSTGESILDTKNKPLVFSKYYIEVTNHLSSFDFFGLGQRLYKLQMGPGNYTIWPKDNFADIETGESGHNTYGQQPLYLMREPSGNYHIVLLRNSNAMEIQIRKNRTLKYQVTGGILDFHIFVGSKDPEAIIEKYHEYLGKWTIPPFWSMGFHQSRYGYKNISEFRESLQGYKDNQIPLDAIWSDIDYMQDYLDFTINPSTYPIEELKNTLKEFDKKWVPIIDAGIGTSNNPENIAYKKGLEKDLFLKNIEGKNLLAKVWPGEAVFPEFFHPEAENYWMEMLGVFNNTIPFDGIWLDMNEVSNFCQGECGKTNSASEYKDLPFVPGSSSLENGTVSLDAAHFGNIKEFDAYSLFNLLQQKATFKYLQNETPLPFILTRANIFGSGRYSSLWFGDPVSDWKSMQYSIPSMINFNLYGIPHVGADICGFVGDTTPDLCLNWTQLGVFYPFAKNHNMIDYRFQEPFRFEEEYMRPMKEAIKFRYTVNSTEKTSCGMIKFILTSNTKFTFIFTDLSIFIISFLKKKFSIEEKKNYPCFRKQVILEFIEVSFRKKFSCKPKLNLAF